MEINKYNSKRIIYHNMPIIENDEIEAVVEALGNSELTIGNKVKTFEQKFFEYIGIPSIAVSSGTSALHLALTAIGISKNDEVILPSYTCIAVALPVLYQQAKPILVDVNDDYNISVEDIKKKTSKKTKAVIVPHMFGYPADLYEIKEFCEEKGFYLVEDCAQSIGALYDTKKVGTIGDISIFSFYATKMMTTIQGGMVCTTNRDWLQTVKDLRYHDQCRSCEDNDPRIKYSYMMSDIGASVGIVQLSKLDSFINRRRVIARMYETGLTNDNISNPILSNLKKHVFSRYVVRTSYDPSIIIEKMRDYNIICERMHIPPLHRRALLHKFNKNVGFSNTDKIIDSAVSLPIYPSLSDEEVGYVIDTFNKITRSL